MNKKETVYAKIDTELKKITQKQAIDLEIDYKDYVSLALKHYSNHVENNDLDME